MPTVVELRKLAKSRGLKGYSKLNKKQLETLLSKPPPITSRTKKPAPPKRTTSNIPIPESVWKKVIYSYTLLTTPGNEKHLSSITKTTKFTSDYPGLDNKTLSQIKTLAFQDLRRSVKVNIALFKRMYDPSHFRLDQLTDEEKIRYYTRLKAVNEARYHLEMIVDGKPIAVILKVYAEKPKSLKEYQIIQKRVKKTWFKKPQKTLTELAVKKAKLSNQLPEELYEKVREKKFKRVMRQI